jgi:nicotinamidase-related amidase
MQDSPALLLIDIQKDYFPGGKMELNGAEEAARQAAKILQCFRSRRLPIVHIAHEAARPGATFFLPGTEGREIHSLVHPRAGEPVVTKNFPNSFLGTPLLEILRQQAVSRLVIVGMMTHMCVDATARAAKDLGLHCTLVHDATATRDLAFTGNPVPAAQVQTAFIAALSAVCDRTLTANECICEITDKRCSAAEPQPREEPT